MSLFDKLFGRSQPRKDAPRETAGFGRPTPKLSGPEHSDSRGARRPFDIVGEALQAWEAGETTRAEKSFNEGIAAYRRREPDGLDFALGRYGAFLIEQDRKDEAIRVLEEAVNRKTDIPDIWSDYIRLIADRRDLQAFKAAIERMAASVKYRDWPRALTMLGEDVVLWRGNQVQIMDPYGRLLWSVEFSKNVTGVAAHGDTLVCAAGVLTAFRRRRV